MGVNGVKHREDGPALEWANGIKEWYHNGVRHRGDGPAIRSSWFINGKRCSEEEITLLQFSNGILSYD